MTIFATTTILSLANLSLPKITSCLNASKGKLSLTSLVLAVTIF